jgi:hypothetical protein
MISSLATESSPLDRDSPTVVTQGQTQIGTGVTDIGSGTVTDLEVLDVLSDSDDLSYTLVTGNEGELGLRGRERVGERVGR